MPNEICGECRSAPCNCGDETKRLVDAAMESAHRNGHAAAKGNAYLLRSPARKDLDAHITKMQAVIDAALTHARADDTASRGALVEALTNLGLCHPAAPKSEKMAPKCANCKDTGQWWNSVYETYIVCRVCPKDDSK